MKKLRITDALEELCKKSSSWGVYILWSLESYSYVTEKYEFDVDRPSELCKAAPYLDQQDDCSIIHNEQGFVLCDSKEEAYNIFNQTVGDDGPTELNSYNGDMRVYALVIGPNGYETENT